MPSFENYPTSHIIKALYMGDTGAGKTGSLCSLAAAGYNVRILDLDNGVELIKDFVLNAASPYRKASPPLWTAEQAKRTPARISHVTISEERHMVGGRLMPKATAWNKIMAQLTEWKDGDRSLGRLETWGAQDVLVIDSLTKFAEAAWNFQLALNGRLTTRPEQSDYWQAQKMMREPLELLQSTATGCHVVIICHVDYIKQENGTMRGYPQTIGNKLSVELGRLFNHTIMAQSKGQGTLVKRLIHTNTTGMVDLKNPAPLRVKPEYELGTGLAEYWRDVIQAAPAGRS